MFKFDNYVDGAKPWVISSWALFICMVLCYVCVTLGAFSFDDRLFSYLPFAQSVNPYIAVAVPVFAVLSFAINLALKVDGGYMEVDNTDGHTRQYLGRTYLSFGFNVSYVIMCVDLVQNHALPESWIVSSYVYGSALSFILFFVFMWGIRKQFKAGWEERRLRNEKERLWSIVTSITCTEKNPLNDNFISQLNSLEQSLKESSDYVQVQKTVVAVRKLAGVLDFMDEVLKPKNNS